MCRHMEVFIMRGILISQASIVGPSGYMVGYMQLDLRTFKFSDRFVLLGLSAGGEGKDLASEITYNQIGKFSLLNKFFASCLGSEN